MSLENKIAIFMYAGKSFSIQCKGKDKVIEMIQKFLNKFNPDSKIVEYFFIYEGKKIEPSNYQMSIEENDFGKKESFILSVEKNIKVIECPLCNYGDCVVSLSNYKTTFYNCEHDHLKISSYDNYFFDQIFFPEKIICSDNKPNCRLNAKNDPDFQLCLTCSNTAKRTKSVCTNCIKEHKESKHMIIKYEDKNYYCHTHMKKKEKYCFQCKKNLCPGCVKEHFKDKNKAEHQIKSFDLLIPEEKEIQKLKDSLDEIKKCMEQLQIVINDLIYTLNGSMRIYDNYYKIANSIIEKYESFNKGEEALKNFTIFKCLYNLKNSNNQILEDLKSVIKEKDKFEKAKNLIKIYSNKKKEYNSTDKTGEDLNKEDDSKWIQEISEKEKDK